MSQQFRAAWPVLGTAVVAGALALRHYFKPIQSKPKPNSKLHKCKRNPCKATADDAKAMTATAEVSKTDASHPGSAAAAAPASAAASALSVEAVRKCLVQPSAAAGKNPHSVSLHLLCDKPEAAPALAPGMHAQWSVGYAAFGLHTPEDVANDLLRNNCNFNRIPITVVAYVGNEVAGTASLDRQDIPAPHPYAPVGPWLVSVFVLPQHRGKGLAHFLVGSVVALARDVIGSPHIWLFTYSHESASALYVRHGFKTIEHTHFPAEPDSASAATATAPAPPLKRGKGIEIMRADFF